MKGSLKARALLAERDQVCSLRSRAPLRLFVRSLAHPLTPELMGKGFMSMNGMRRFHTVSAHYALCMCFHLFDSSKGSHPFNNFFRNV